MLLQMGEGAEKSLPTGRSCRDQAIIDRAKRILVERNGITEEQAHHFLQKESMESGIKLVQAALLIADGAAE